MTETFKRLVRNKEEIVKEDIKTVKMFVPLSFDLKDGKCVNEADQELFEFLEEREDIIQENETEDDSQVESTQQQEWE